MTTPVASPPFQLDIRVASSPLVGMRFLLDGRATDLDALGGQLDEFMVEAAAERAALRARLRDNEERRTALLNAIAKTTPEEMAACCTEGFELCASLGTVEERIAGLRLRIDGLRSEATALRKLSGEIMDVRGNAVGAHDAELTRYNRAVRQLHAWVDDDHDRLAQAVSDGALQQLADAAVSVELVGRLVSDGSAVAAAEELDRCREAVRAAKSDVAAVIEELRTPQGAGGLVNALRVLVNAIRPSKARFTLIGDDRPLAASTELAIYRIAQEAVANAMRHGRAERIDVVLSLHSERAVLVVRDDGEGFDAVATEARLGKTRSYGLIAMRQRAALEGGNFEVRSLVGAGTDVRASFPLR